MSSIYGEALRVSIFGQSHAPAIGVTIDGLPAGFSIDMEALAAFLRRYGKPVTACADIPQAVAQLLENTPPDGASVCCGSLYLLGDVAQALEKL